MFSKVPRVEHHMGDACVAFVKRVGGLGLHRPHFVSKEPQILKS